MFTTEIAGFDTSSMSVDLNAASEATVDFATKDVKRLKHNVNIIK